MRYAYRDPASGKFVKTERINWKEVKIMTTIDNETHADVTEQVVEAQTDLPAMLRDDESTIRSTFQKFVDGVVSLSSYARQVDMLESKMQGLLATIEEANQRVLAANQERDQAKVEALEAKAGERMAKEAYAHIAEEMDTVKYDLQVAKDGLGDLRMELASVRKANHDLAEEHFNVQKLLEVAREERDRYREEAGSFQAKWEDEQFKNIDFEETKEKLSTTEEALNICAKNTAEARAQSSAGWARVQELERECSGLHSKVNALEDDNARQGRTITELQTKISNATAHLNY